MPDASVAVKVWGDYACFTRPEMKVERVSYPVMTPSAARNILQAIFWKPEFQYQVREIHILNPIKHFSMVTNEIKSRQSFEAAMRWMKNGGGYYAEDNRTQRHTLGLRDVAYVIRAEMVLEPHATDPVIKYLEQFNRRVKRGQCFRRPYLGMRQFAAHFAAADGSEQPIALDEDLGLMLFDLSFLADGTATPIFAPFQLRQGVMVVPPELYAQRRTREG